MRNEGLVNRPNIYQPIIADIMGGKGLHGGSLYNQEQRAKNKAAKAAAAAAAAREAGAGAEIGGLAADAVLLPGETGETGQAEVGSVGNDEPHSIRRSSSRYDDLIDSAVEQFVRAKHIRAEPAAIIADWLCADEPQVQEAVEKHRQLLGMAWSTWKIKVKAAEDIMTALGWMDGAAGSPSSSSRGTTSSSSAIDWAHEDAADGSSSGSMQGTGEDDSSSSSSSSSSDEDHNGGSSSSSSSDEDQHEAGTSADAHLDVMPGPSSSSNTLQNAGAAGSPTALTDMVLGKVLHPMPDARERLKHALQFAEGSGLHYELPSAAVAAAAVSLNLASFSPQLWDVPAKSHPLVGQLLLAQPKGFSDRSFALKCHGLMELFKLFPVMKEEVSRGSVAQLAKLVSCPFPRLQLLSFFVGNSKYPYPWAVPLDKILTHTDGKQFLVKAYPEFDSWAEAKGLNTLRAARRARKAAAEAEQAKVAEASSKRRRRSKKAEAEAAAAAADKHG